MKILQIFCLIGKPSHCTFYVIVTLLLFFVSSKASGQEQSSTIVYSTYYGGIGTDDADAVTIDPLGNTYLGCHSTSGKLLGVSEYPYTLSGGMDAFIVKINNKCTEVDYLTHLGGSKWDAVQGLIADSVGNIYAVGTTYSDDFPVDTNGFQPTFGGESDAFVVKLNSDGKVVWSTYLGGSGDEDGRDIAIDQTGNIHIVGRTESNDFPTLAGALQSQSAGGIDAFIATLDPEGKILTTSYFGGSGNDIGFGIELDSIGRRYIVGTTNSSNFPVYNAFQEVNHGNDDLFFAVIDTTGSAIEFASYWGGKGDDKAYSIDLGPSGDIFIMGITNSSDFPTTLNAFQRESAGANDAFITKLNLHKKSIIYSTYIGGESEDSPRNLVVDDKGNAYLIGKTASNNFPTVNNQQTKLSGRADAFITMLDASGSFLRYSTLFGGQGSEIFEGVAIDAAGTLTLSGLSDSFDFPIVNPLQDTFLGGRYDIVVTRFAIQKQE